MIKAEGRDKPELAHRVSWFLSIGPIPNKMCVLHRCDNPGCVRLDHLFLGTRADNNLDMIKKGRASGGRVGGRKTVTDDQVREMRAMGLTTREAADKYKTSYQNAWRILKWKSRKTTL